MESALAPALEALSSSAPLAHPDLAAPVGAFLATVSSAARVESSPSSATTPYRPPATPTQVPGLERHLAALNAAAEALRWVYDDDPPSIVADARAMTVRKLSAVRAMGKQKHTFWADSLDVVLADMLEYVLNLPISDLPPTRIAAGRTLTSSLSVVSLSAF
jgi:hypothetical protein